MKKLFILICMLALGLVLPVEIYSQTPEQAGMATSISTVKPYSATAIQRGGNVTIFKSDFLKSVNTVPSYADSPAEKGGVGTINAVTGWTDIPIEMATTADESDMISGLTYGFGKGVVTGVARSIAGVIDIATFAIPPYDEPMMQPNYKVNKPMQDGLKIKFFEW